jgi:geranylgeranyl diphosphate synthase, type I
MGESSPASAERVDIRRLRAEQVFGFLEGLVASLPGPSSHRELLRIPLDEGREQARDVPDLACIRLPLLVHAAVAGVEGPALPLAAACTLIYLGADVLDNVADDELPPRWVSRNAAEATLAAATLLAPLPILALAELGPGRSRAWEIQRALAAGLVEASAGQHEDLVASERAGLEACRRVAELKSGAELGCFARAAALLAGAEAAAAEAFAAYGTALGTAAGLASDLGELYRGSGRRDLRNRKRLLPVVHALQTLDLERRERLRQLLSRGSGPDVIAELRELLVSAGSLHYTALIVEVYVRRGLRALAGAGAGEPAAGDLRGLLERVSLLGGERE